MNYDKIGTKIRNIRETELKQSREEFAEEIGVSTITVARLENSTSKVNNIETYLRISEISGYTIDEIVLDKNDTKSRERLRRRIEYFLNVMSDEELEYTLGNIHRFLTFTHRNQVNTLKDIKNKMKN